MDQLNKVDLVLTNGQASSKELDNTKIKYIKKFIYSFIKRFFDIICAIFGCLFILPIALVIKISYLHDKDGNSIFYTQDRIGKDGKLFKLYKFRSMYPNADVLLNKLLSENEELAEEYKINKKLHNDPRITRIGKFIRKTSIDEIPQVLNVLKGEMSLIGNRPYLPREKNDMGIYFDAIVKTKPGITGYWQTSGRSNITFETRCKLEAKYSRICSLKLDLKIFFKTFKVIFKKTGK